MHMVRLGPSTHGSPPAGLLAQTSSILVAFPSVLGLQPAIAWPGEKGSTALIACSAIIPLAPNPGLGCAGCPTVLGSGLQGPLWHSPHFLCSELPNSIPVRRAALNGTKCREGCEIPCHCERGRLCSGDPTSQHQPLLTNAPCAAGVELNRTHAELSPCPCHLQWEGAGILPPSARLVSVSPSGCVLSPLMLSAPGLSSSRERCSELCTPTGHRGLRSPPCVQKPSAPGGFSKSMQSLTGNLRLCWRGSKTLCILEAVRGVLCTVSLPPGCRCSICPWAQPPVPCSPVRRCVPVPVSVLECPWCLWRSVGVNTKQRKTLWLCRNSQTFDCCQINRAIVFPFK